MSKPDWFKVYPSKLLQDSLVDGMTTEELGCAFRLLCRQWIDGAIPDDLTKIARLCRVDANRMGDLWVTLSEWFPQIGGGQRANRYMFVERDMVEGKMEKKSTIGRDSANKRWDAVRKIRDAQPMPHPLGDPMQEKRVESTEKNTDTPKTSSPSRARKAKKEKLPIPEEYLKDLQVICNDWPRRSKKQEGGYQDLRVWSDPADLWEAMTKNFPNDDPALMIKCGLVYLDQILPEPSEFDLREPEPPSFCYAMMNFYGPKMAYWKLKKEAARAKMEEQK